MADCRPLATAAITMRNLQGVFLFVVGFSRDGCGAEENRNISRYNVFAARMVIRHAQDGRLYLYDLLRIKRIKKETSKPLEQ